MTNEPRFVRVSRDDIYMAVAREFSRRSTCNRKAVGAVLVRDNHLLGTGYNGAARTQPECLDAGCNIVDGHCVRTVHAEINAILSAAYNGVSTKKATMYTTVKPCFRCLAAIINAGIDEVVYAEDYQDAFNELETDLVKLRRYSYAKE